MAYIIETVMREAFNENHDSIGHGWMDGWMNGWMDGWMVLIDGCLKGIESCGRCW